MRQDEVDETLRSAKTRLLNPKPAEAYPYPCHMHEQPALRSSDMALLVRAYLDEHQADDGEPVSEEWLRAVGFAEHWYPSMLGPERTTDFRVVFGVDWKNGSVCLHAGHTTFATPIKAPTRGHVRRLCKALGVPLRAEAKEE